MSVLVHMPAVTHCMRLLPSRSGVELLVYPLMSGRGLSQDQNTALVNDLRDANRRFSNPYTNNDFDSNPK